MNRENLKHENQESFFYFTVLTTLLVFFIGCSENNSKSHKSQ